MAGPGRESAQVSMVRWSKGFRRSLRCPRAPKSLVGIGIAGRVQEWPGRDEPGPEVRAHALAAPGGDEGAIGMHVRSVLMAAPAVDVVQPCPVPLLRRPHGRSPSTAFIRSLLSLCPRFRVTSGMAGCGLRPGALGGRPNGSVTNHSSGRSGTADVDARMLWPRRKDRGALPELWR